MLTGKEIHQSVTRQELVKCNVSSTQDWNARIYNQVVRLLILRTVRLVVLGKFIATPFLAHKHVINTISYWGQILNFLPLFSSIGIQDWFKEGRAGQGLRTQI
jgi:hypothetical protein